MARPVKSRKARSNPASEIRQAKHLVDRMLDLDSKQLRIFALGLSLMQPATVVTRVIEVLVDRAFEEDSGPASDAVGYFGRPVYLAIIQAFAANMDSSRRSRIVGLLGRLGAELNQEEFMELGNHFVRLCQVFEGEPLAQLISAHRAMRMSFEEQQRKPNQPV
jgi:hypothetical protein